MLGLAARYLRGLGLTLWSFFRYWGVALFAFLADLTITALLSASGLSIRANALATGTVMTIVLFWLNRKVVFKFSSLPWERDLVPFLVISGAHMLLSQALLTLTANIMSAEGVLYDTLTRAFVLAVLAVAKFIVVSRFLFGGNKRLG